MVPELWENWGRRRQGQPRKNLCSLPSPPQHSQLSKRLVQFVAGAGMYRVFHMASVQSYTGSFIFILTSSAVASCSQSPLLLSAHLSPAPLPHTMGHFGFETLIGSAGGVQREPWRREVGPETVKPLVLFLSPITQP